MSRNEEKQKNHLNRLYLAKTQSSRPVKRPALSQIHSIDELRRWLVQIEREIQMTLDQTKSVRYTDEKVKSMYDRISQLEIEHKSFRRKIGQLKFGNDVNVLVKTIPVQNALDFYRKKSIPQDEQSLDEFFAKKPDLPLLSQDDYQPLTLPRSSLVNYSDSEDEH